MEQHPVMIYRSTFLVFILIALSSCATLTISAAEESLQVTSEAEIQALAQVLKPHELFALLWPQEEDIRKHVCPVSVAQTNDAVLRLSSILKTNMIPNDLVLLPMRGWGRPTEKYMERGGSDAFIAHFAKGGFSIQLIDYLQSVFVAVRPGNSGSVIGDENRKQFVFQTAQAVFDEKVLVKDASELWVWAKRSSKDALIGNWTPATNIIGKGNGGAVLVRTDGDTVCSRVSYWTNGKFALFELTKNEPGHDPYRARFSQAPEPGSQGKSTRQSGETGIGPGTLRSPLRAPSELTALRERLQAINAKKADLANPEQRIAAVRAIQQEADRLKNSSAPAPDTNAVTMLRVISTGLAHLASEEPDVATRSIMIDALRTSAPLGNITPVSSQVGKGDREKMDSLIQQMTGEAGTNRTVSDPQATLSGMPAPALLYAAERVEQGPLPLHTKYMITRALANSEDPALFPFFVRLVQRGDDEKLTRFALRGLERILERQGRDGSR